MNKLFVAIVVLIVLAVAVFIALKGGSGDQELPEDVSGSVAAETQSQNSPSIKVPSLNPAEKANPFNNVYKNPFE